MGKGLRGDSFAKSSSTTLGGVIKTGRAIKADCMACSHTHVMGERDLAILLEAFGPDYRLRGRRFQCSQCQGWMRLWFDQGGIWWRLWDDEDTWRWQQKDATRG